jgi:hypothetical protein
MTTLNIFRRKRHKEAPTDPGLEAALINIRIRMQDFAMLMRAAQVAAADDDNGTGILEFAEDYGMDQIDPIRRIDVLRYALKRIEEGRG